jgi:hypothetical protein
MSDLCNIVNRLTGCTEDVSKDPKARYSRISISLYEAFTDRELHLAGNFIGVAYITGGGTCEIKLDYEHANKINLREIEGIKGNFSKIYATSNGKGGFCYLYICQAMETTINPKKASVFTHTVRTVVRNSTNIVRRVQDDYHRYANRIQIRNTHAVNGVDFGYVPIDSIPDTADFRNDGYRLIAQDAIAFTEVDLYSLGFVSTIDDASVTLKMIATML